MKPSTFLMPHRKVAQIQLNNSNWLILKITATLECRWQPFFGVSLNRGGEGGQCIDRLKWDTIKNNSPQVLSFKIWIPMYLKHIWYNSRIGGHRRAPTWFVNCKINYHHVMVELDKYIYNVKRVSLWCPLVIAPYEIHTTPINKHMDEK